MKRNMDQWTKELLAAPVKKAVPVLSFPSIQLLGITVKDLINDSDLQARGMKAVADRTERGRGCQPDGPVARGRVLRRAHPFFG